MTPLSTLPHPDSELLKHTLEASTDSMEIDDIEGRVVLVNDAWCRMFRMHKDDATGTRWDLLGLDVHDISELGISWDRCIATGRSEGFLQFERKDRFREAVKYGRLLHRDLNGIPNAVITCFKPPEQRNQTDEAWDFDFDESGQESRRIEHNLRNVLTMMVLNVDLLSRSTEDHVMVKRLALIKAAVRSGLELVDELRQCK